MNQAASSVPPTPHDPPPVPPTAQTMATSSAASDSQCAPVGLEPGTGPSGAPASAPTSLQSCDGSIGPLDRNPATTRPQSPTGLPPPKHPVPGVAARPDAASHHGYELTAPRHGIAYAQWRPLWLCEALPSPMSAVPSNPAGSPTSCSPLCGDPAEGVDEHSVYVVAGSSGADGEPPTGFPIDVDMQPTDSAEPPRPWPNVASPFTVGASPSTFASATDPTVVSDVLPTTHKTTTDTSPTSRSSSTPPVTVAMAQRGLGSAGSVPIPDELWSECAPSNLHWAAANAPSSHSLKTPCFICWLRSLLSRDCCSMLLLVWHLMPKLISSPNQCRSVLLL